MKAYQKNICTLIIVIAILGLTLACGGGGGGDSATSSSIKTEELCTITGTLAETISEAIGEAIYSNVPIGEINRVKAVDTDGNIYYSVIKNRTFSLSLPSGKSYVIGFMRDNDFVAVLSYKGINWVEFQPGRRIYDQIWLYVL